ncbi:MAG: sugar ABC transporter permease [Anaerolineae bacterium]|nr:sugar ABC transporter permease [Anaerolineae bacterium]MCB0243282.1 sugar ABC transporter permease [Anaerolineae bacterium]MCB9142705.1 sugar ABC transporter permease [Anaerolineales bacterium]MCO5246353.1 sugar ABC transporter permease [Anaerolineae bacterium]HRX02623.1 sugar ABC transporter permease [Anaerolineae bacterium]
MTQSSAKRRRKPFPFHIVVFLLPATIIYTIFMVYPLLDSMRLSLFTNSGGSEVFVGLQNYVTLLTDELWSPRFWGALQHNAVFFVIHMVVQNSIGLLLAALLTSRAVRGVTFFRTVYFLPVMLSVVIVGFIWQLILSPLWGIAKGMLDLVGLEQLFKPWLGLEGPALIALALISVWQFIGIPLMLFYAVLISIPEELEEAATVDGASGWSIFWHIKFPLILPTVGIVAILTYVGNFNAFDLIYTTQGGLAGPNFSTDIMGTLFYRTFFGHQLQLGNPTMGATVATMMFLIILAGVLVYLFLWQRRVQTYEL